MVFYCTPKLFYYNRDINHRETPTMNALNQIAAHLKIESSKILKCEEWASVWFVVLAGKGGRFVSKKVVKKQMPKQVNKSKPILRVKSVKTNSSVQVTEQKRLLIPSVEYALRLLNQNTWGITKEKKQELAQYCFDNQYAILEGIAKYHGREYDSSKSKNACAQYWL